MAKRMVF